MRKLLRETPHKIRDYGEVILREEKKDFIAMTGIRMRKKLAIMVVLMGALSVNGCSESNANVNARSYKGSYQYTHINIGKDYVLRNYDKVENDSGCAITIYFEKTQEEK